MSTAIAGNNQGDAARHQEAQEGRALSIAQNGLPTLKHLRHLMAAGLCDLIECRMPPSTANAACNFAEKIMLSIEVERKFSKPGESLTIFGD